MVTANRDIIAIGASAGGFAALRLLAGKLPETLDASLLVTVHLADDFPSGFDRILDASGPLPARFARDGETIERGHIYIAPPQRHLLLDEERLKLGRGPRENNARPAIDPMFRSVALCCGPRSIGVVLSGMLGDGAAGLQALKRCGAVTVVQEPGDAMFSEMPTQALRRVDPDHVVALAALPALLKKLVRRAAGEPVPIPDGLRPEVDTARSGQFIVNAVNRVGRRSVLACPDCHGALRQIEEGGPVRYRCHSGHAYTAEMIVRACEESLSNGLVCALGILDERIVVTQKLYDEAIACGHSNSAEWWQRRLEETRREAKIIRGSILRMEQIAGDTAS